MRRSLHSYLKLLAVIFVLISVQHSWAQVGCGGFSGPAAFGGAISTRSGEICLNRPVSGPADMAAIMVTASNVADGNDPNNFAIEINWDDGSPNQIVAFGGPITVNNTGPHSYLIPEISHRFLARPCNAPPGAQCSYSPRIYLRIAGTTCLAPFGTSPAFFRFNTDDQCSGDMVLSESATGAPVYEVCEGATTVVTFTDRTRTNCLPPQEITALNNVQRHRRFTYGTFNNITGVVLVAGAPVNPAPTGTVGPVVASFTPIVNSNPPFTVNTTSAITIPSTAVAGQEFHIRMDYWNQCNPYLAGETPVPEYGIIRVVARPAPPTANHQEVCNGDPINAFSINAPGARDRVFWYRDNVGVPGAAVTNPNGINSTSFPTNSYPGGAISNTTAGVYRMWASYRMLVNGANLRCESQLIPITITIRNPVPSPTFNTGTSPVCNGTTGVAFGLSTAAGTLTSGGATEYLWSVVNASNGAVSDVTLNIAPGAQTVTADFNIADATFAGAPTIVRKIRARRRFVNTPFCASPWVEYSVTVNRNTQAGTVTGGDTRCEGAPLNTLNWTPGVGNIVRWEMQTNAGPFVPVPSFGTSTSNDPTSLGLTAISGVTTLYRFRVQVQNGNCAMVASNSVLYTINPNTVTAEAGPSSTICSGTPGVFSTTFAADPPGMGVTGLWSRVSGPGTVTFGSASSYNSTVSVSLPGVHVFRWTLDNGTCESQDEVQIIFGNAPGIPAPNNDAFCGLSGTLTATANTGSETALWTLAAGPQPGTATIASPTNTTSNVTVSAYGTYVFDLTFTGVACLGDNTRQATISFFQASTSAAEPDKTICVDGSVLAPIPITGIVGGGAANGHWEIVSGTGTFTSSGTALGSNVAAINPTSDSYTPSPGDFTSGSVTLRLVATPAAGSPCANITDDLVITFDRTPSNVGFNNSPFSVCGTTASLNAMIPVNGIGLWSVLTAGPTLDDPSDPGTGVSNLQMGANTFRWTVTSALGVCAPIEIDFTITRIPALTAISITPSVCESSANSGIATGVDLTLYNSTINGGELTTVTWYRDASHTTLVGIPTNEPITNNETFYVVVSTAGPPPCTSQAIVTFTVEGKPFVANLNPSLCEDGMGTGVVNGVDLALLYDVDVSLSQPNRSVTWFSDATLNTSVAMPVNGITNGTIYYARVENTLTGCFNRAEVTFSINPIPPDNPILGPSLVCHDPATVVFFTVTTYHPGYSYQWNIPAGVTVTTGDTDDFFVLLQFPTADPAGYDIEVTETSPEGCPGTPQTLHIDVDTKPTATINGPTEVCAFQTDVLFSVPIVSGTYSYAWSVPAGASIILGQGTNEIRVNFGSTAGDVTVIPATSGGCAGTPASHHVDVNGLPVLASQDKEVCSQSLSEIQLTTASGPTAVSFIYSGYAPDPNLVTQFAAPAPPLGSETSFTPANYLFNDRYRNQTPTPLNVQYVVSGVSADGCEGPNNIITLVVKPEPQLDPFLSKSICSDEQTGITLVSLLNTFPADGFVISNIAVPSDVSAAVPANIQWPGPAIRSADVISDDAWINSSASNQNVVYTVIPYSSLLDCFGPPTDVIVEIYPRTIVDPITVAPLCNGTPLNVTFASTNNPGGTYHWRVVTYDNWVTVGSPASGTGNISNLGLVNNRTDIDGTVTFEVYARNTASEGPGCTNPVQTFVVTINRKTQAANQLLQACSDTPGGTTYTVNLLNLEHDINSDAGTADVQVTWYSSNPTLGPATVIPTGSLSAYVMTNGVAVFAEVLYVPTGCRAVARVEYEISPSVSFTTTLSNFSGFNLNCNNDKSGQIRIDVPIGMGTPTFSYRLNMGATNGPWINAGANTYTFSSLDARNDYVVDVQDAKGCIATAPVVLVQPPVMSATLSEVDPITCFLRQDGSISTQVTGGTGTYTQYLLLQTNMVDADIDGIFTGLGAATYNVRVTDSNGCKVDSSPLSLTQPAAVEINNVSVLTDANGFNLSCRDAVDGEIALAVSGGNVPNNYTITMTKASDPTNPISATTTLHNHTFTGLGFGNYSIVATDAKGCPSLPAAAIIVNPPPFSPGFIGINQAVCAGDDAPMIDQLVPAFGGVGNYQYQWQLSLTGSMNDAEWVNIPLATATTYDPGVLAQTTYFRRLASSVSARTGTACEVLGKDNIVQVTINPLPVVAFNGPSEVCQGESFTLTVSMTGGAAPIEYDYSAGSTTFLNMIGTENTMIPMSNFQAPQDYQLIRVKDLNGCLAANVPQMVHVDVIKTNSDFTVLAPAEQCSGGTFSFQWNVEAGMKYTWIWSDGSQDVINDGDRPLGNNTITHVFTSGNTQTSTPYPVRLQAENALCSPKFTTKNITVLPSVRLNILPGDTILCSGESIRFIDQSEGVDIGRWYYRPVGSGEEREVRSGPLSEITYQMFNTTTTNPIFLEVVYEASNSEGCGDVYTKQVKVYRGITAGILNTPDPPNPFIGGISTVEFTNNSAPLDPSAFEYTWDFDDARATPPTGSGINPITVDYFKAGTKNVKLTAVNILSRDENNTCSSTIIKPITIMLPTVGAAFKATPLASCFPVNITVENLSPGADTFSWELYDQTGLVGTSNLREPEFRILTPGVYDIYLTASYYSTGQTATAVQKGIEVFDVPTALFEMRPNPLYVPDTELQTFNKSVRATEYHWDFDDGTLSNEFEPRHYYKLEGKYNVQLVAGKDWGAKDIDGDGIIDGHVVCYDTTRSELVALDGGFVKLPNAFTPSVNGSTGGVAGNGTFNDVFLPIARGVEEFEMQIFDRWGNLLFETQDRNVGWDGYDRNHRQMPAGVYVYKLIMRLSNGQRTTKIGDVTLIR